MASRVRLTNERSLDLTARLIVVASFLYYRCSMTMMGDHEFDELCQRAADNWVWLSPTRQFMLVHPADIRSSGFGVRITMAAEAAALQWASQADQPTDTFKLITKWRWCAERRLHWSYL